VVIHQLRNLAKKRKDENGLEGDIQAEDVEVVKILKNQEVHDTMDLEKQKEREVIDLMVKSEKVSEAQIADCTFSVLLNASDLKQVLAHHNEMASDKTKFEKQCEEL